MPVPSRSLPVAVALVASLPVAHAAAASVEPLPQPQPAVLEIAPGVAYQRVVDGAQTIHVVRTTPSSGARLRVVLPGGATTRRGSVQQAVLDRSDAGVVAAVNGDYFNLTSGYPSGLTVVDGRLLSEPEPTRSALVIGADGVLQSGRFTLAGRWQTVTADGLPLGPSHSIPGLNRPAEKSNETLLYTGDAGSSTPTGASRNDAVVTVDGGAPLTPGGAVLGSVSAVGTGGTAVPAGAVAVTGVGSARAPVARELPVGQRVRIDTTIGGFPAGADAVGGGPLLVDAGSAVPAFTEGFSSSQINQRTSRTAVGQLADGGYLLVTVEGSSQGRSGMTAAEQAALMARLGARLAVGMDAGGSAQMVVLGAHVVPWSSPRAVTTAVALDAPGVRVAPLARRLSPNGDGIEDTAVAQVTAPEAGHLRVSLVRRGEPGQVVVDRDVPAGTTPVPIDPRDRNTPDGPYSVAAELTPTAGGSATSAARSLVFDGTLGHLSARAFRLRAGRTTPRPSVAIRFRLTRPARVTVRVQNAAGVTRRTLRAGRLMRAGTVQFVWDRHIGRAVATGRVRIVVEARTSYGSAGLVAPITLAPVPVTTPAPPRRG